MLAVLRLAHFWARLVDGEMSTDTKEFESELLKTGERGASRR